MAAQPDSQGTMSFILDLVFFMAVSGSLRHSEPHFQRGKYVPIRLCKRFLGLMAPALVVVLMEYLHMRRMQHWVASPVSEWLSPSRDLLIALCSHILNHRNRWDLKWCL